MDTKTIVLVAAAALAALWWMNRSGAAGAPTATNAGNFNPSYPGGQPSDVPGLVWV